MMLARGASVAVPRFEPHRPIVPVAAKVAVVTPAPAAVCTLPNSEKPGGGTDPVPPLPVGAEQAVTARTLNAARRH